MYNECALFETIKKNKVGDWRLRLYVRSVKADRVTDVSEWP